ncbi:MAG: 2'-5' RNA ligase family protein [Actinomycetota bacterium]|nr:2'-5' RNA ligase family protein [Actinomycetota bacterium]MDQ2957205.1 2'-5' RNA ligase family protein [Actinomycetota bacterium]
MSRPLPPADHSGLVVLLPELDPVVGQWRSRFDAVVTGVLAHVSVLVPWIAPGEITEADLDAVGQLAKSWDPIEVSFTRFEIFDSASGPSVHWLAPEPAEPFLGLTDDFGTCWPEYPPYGGVFGPEPVPHLTVSSTGTDAELQPMFAAVRARLPVSTIATELAVLQVIDGQCQTRRSFRLGGKRR